MKASIILSREWVEEAYPDYNVKAFRMHCYKTSNGAGSVPNADWTALASRESATGIINEVTVQRYRYVGYLLGNKIDPIQFWLNGVKCLDNGNENQDFLIPVDFDKIGSGYPGTAQADFEFFGFMLTLK